MKHIPLTKGFVAIVDDEDFEWLSAWKWQASICNGKVYARRTKKENGTSTTILMHREIAKPLPEEDVDHKNGDTMDCRRENLVPGTTAQNLWNSHAPPRGKSGVRGVHFNRHGFPCSAIKANGKAYHLGVFDTVEDASAAYEAAFALRAAGRASEIRISNLVRTQHPPHSHKKGALL